MKKLLLILIVVLIWLLLWNHLDNKELMPAVADNISPTETPIEKEHLMVVTKETESIPQSSSELLPAVENPNNLPVLTGNETEEGLYWDPVWHHETYLEFAVDIKVWFDEAGNKYSYPVDASGNPITD